MKTKIMVMKKAARKKAGLKLLKEVRPLNLLRRKNEVFSGSLVRDLAPEISYLI